MRPGLIATLLLPITIGCGGNGDGADTAGVADSAARPASGADTGFAAHTDGFALLRDNDTVAIERYTRSGETLRGEIRDSESGNRMTYSAAIGEDDLVRRLELSLYERNAADPETQVRVELSGQSLIAEQREGAQTETDTVGVPPGTLLYFNPSIAMMEQMLRRSRTMAGQRVEMPVFTISSGEEPRLDRPTISRIGSDSVEVVRDRSNRVRLAIGEDGRINSGVNSSNVQIRRLP